MINIKKGLEGYSGVKRRFEIKYNSKINDIIVIDDYAHHPSEVLATLNAAKNGWNKKIVAVFQPHLFSRTQNFILNLLNHYLLLILLLLLIYTLQEKDQYPEFQVS